MFRAGAARSCRPPARSCTRSGRPCGAPPARRPAAHAGWRCLAAKTRGGVAAAADGRTSWSRAQPSLPQASLLGPRPERPSSARSPLQRCGSRRGRPARQRRSGADLSEQPPTAHSLPTPPRPLLPCLQEPAHDESLRPCGSRAAAGRQRGRAVHGHGKRGPELRHLRFHHRRLRHLPCRRRRHRRRGGPRCRLYFWGGRGASSRWPVHAGFQALCMAVTPALVPSALTAPPPLPRRSASSPTRASPAPPCLAASPTLPPPTSRATPSTPACARSATPPTATRPWPSTAAACATPTPASRPAPPAAASAPTAL